MDEDLTDGIKDACQQCGSSAWGVSDEGRYFCMSCHDVIDRTQEVESIMYTPGSSQVSTISRGSRSKRPSEQKRWWLACEGFQFILMKQADALIKLGVAPSFKDDVLCPLWRRFLQTSKQAYTDHPDSSAKFKMQAVDSESKGAAESSSLSASETDNETYSPSMIASQADSCSDWSTDSQDRSACLAAPRKARRGAMSMAKTLALIHLALVWSRQALTLGDLLRLVNDDHVPYINACQILPEEMTLDGMKASIFIVHSVPTHHALHREAQSLVHFLQLPAFPPIRCQDPLHPAMLSLRYLADANLPDELHAWVCVLMQRSGMADVTCGGSESLSRPMLPQFDICAAALIIVTLKLLFSLDDRTEWDLSNASGDLETLTGSAFNLRQWYRLLHAAMLRTQRAQERAAARKYWKATPLYTNRKLKYVVMKRKRMAEQLTLCLEKLAGCDSKQAPPAPPSSFTFCWGSADDADGPSLRSHKLHATVAWKGELLKPINKAYWHLPLRACEMKKCGNGCVAAEATLPRSFVWLLQLFSFLLQVSHTQLHQEVLNIERHLFTTKVGKANRTWSRGLISQTAKKTT